MRSCGAYVRRVSTSWRASPRGKPYYHGAVALLADHYLRAGAARGDRLRRREGGEAAGLLRGVRATTHCLSRDRLAELGAEPSSERVAEQGRSSPRWASPRARHVAHPGGARGGSTRRGGDPAQHRVRFRAVVRLRVAYSRPPRSRAHPAEQAARILRGEGVTERIVRELVPPRTV